MEFQGIDVAKYQGNINWAKVANTGIKFAILKVTQKNNSIEPSFAANYNGCITNNLYIGGYRYVYAKTIREAEAEANALVKVIGDRKLNMGVWLDMEDASIRGIGKGMLTNIIRTEAAILQQAGFNVGIYCNKYWYDSVLDSKSLKEDYPFWIARYPKIDTGKYNPNSTLAPRSWAVAWQYSSKGKVDGIVGNVDMDVLYTSPSKVFPDKSMYYPACDKYNISVVAALKEVGETDVSLAHRKRIGIANGIAGVGTVTGNVQMLNLLKAGKLKRA